MYSSFNIGKKPIDNASFFDFFHDVEPNLDYTGTRARARLSASVAIKPLW